METVADALADECWSLYVRANPVWATLLGVHDHDEHLPDLSEDGQQRLGEQFADLAVRAEAAARAVPAGEDRTTCEVAADVARAAAAELAAAAPEYTVAPAIRGAHAEILEGLGSITLTAPEHALALFARYHAVPHYLDEAAQRLRAGVVRGRTPTAQGVAASVTQLDAYLARPLDDDVLLRPAAPPGWEPRQASAWRDDLRAAVAGAVRPALQRYRDVLAAEILPYARPPERSGVCWLPGGDAAYTAAVRAHTTIEADPDGLHARGLDDAAALDEEYRMLGEAAFASPDPRSVRERLRTDPALRFASARELLDRARAGLARAQEAVGACFGRLPASPCVVEAMPAHAERDGTVASYLAPAADGSRPGTYFVNTFEPRTRLRHEAEVLAFHEAVPGHHLQIAVVQELHDLPPLRRHAQPTAYVEGWALYTERLADEIGLYSDDLSRLGMVAFDSWRAGRLVVDTGLHHHGWTRAQAVDYLLEHTPLAPGNIVNEVDRYIAWPGQALAYKVGQREIRRLRDDAERRLGSAFDLSTFHDVVLGSGAVPLPTLGRLVAGWVER